MALKTVYGGLSLDGDEFVVACYNPKKQKFYAEKVKIGSYLNASIISWLRDYMDKKKVKFVAIGVVGEKTGRLFSELWLKLDIAPVKYTSEITQGKRIAKNAAEYVASLYSNDNTYNTKVGNDSLVITDPLVTLHDYEEISDLDEWKRLLFLAKKFKGRKIGYFSATPQGGGVALMRHALMRIYEQAGVSARWHVMSEDPGIFQITKGKFHNVLQDIADRSVELTDFEKREFDDWSARNARAFAKNYRDYDYVVIDDPQPSGLVPYIRDENPKAKIIYRSHIHLVAKLANKRGTPQNTSWEFIWDKIKSSDLFVSHPVDEFIPKEFGRKQCVLMGASTDPMDGLNKNLDEKQTDFYFERFNSIVKRLGYVPLDPLRPYIIQIARFDPSKGIMDVLESYAALCKKCSAKKVDTPQLVVVGNDSVDDPDGRPIYKQVTEQIKSSKFSGMKDDIKVLRLPHYDQMLNTLLRSCAVALQLSYREGFEVKVTEALMKGKPVVVYDTGGIPLQVSDKDNGFVVKTGDTEAVAQRLFELVSDKSMYEEMHDKAIRGDYRYAMTSRLALSWLTIFDKMTESPNYNWNCRNIEEIVKANC